MAAALAGQQLAQHELLCLPPLLAAPTRFNQPLVAVIIGGLTQAAGVGLVLSGTTRNPG
jgi:hypothetical protein